MGSSSEKREPAGTAAVLGAAGVGYSSEHLSSSISRAVVFSIEQAVQ